MVVQRCRDGHRRLGDLGRIGHTAVAGDGAQQAEPHEPGDVVDLPAGHVDELHAAPQLVVLDLRDELAVAVGQRGDELGETEERVLGDLVELGDDAGAVVAVDVAAQGGEPVELGQGRGVDAGDVLALVGDLEGERLAGGVGPGPRLLDAVDRQVDELVGAEQPQGRVVALVLERVDQARGPDGRGGEVGLLAHRLGFLEAPRHLQAGHHRQRDQRHRQRCRQLGLDRDSSRPHRPPHLPVPPSRRGLGAVCTRTDPIVSGRSRPPDAARSPSPRNRYCVTRQ